MKAHPAAWALLAAAVLYLGLRRLERFMIFAPAGTLHAHPGTVGLPYERVALTASDGVVLSAWWIPARSAEAPVMLCLHGNAGNMSSRVDKMRIFHDAGAAQLWLDYRGYGESAGRPSEAGLYRDALAGWAWLAADKAIPASRLVLYGESLGAGPAVELASRAPAAGLILDGAFTSVADMSRLVLPRLPPRVAERLVSQRFDNIAKLTRVDLPILILHSPDDEIVPYDMALRNYAASTSQRKTLVQLKGSHNDAFLDSGPAYGAAVGAFLADATAPAKK